MTTDTGAFTYGSEDQQCNGGTNSTSTHKTKGSGSSVTLTVAVPSAATGTINLKGMVLIQDPTAMAIGANTGETFYLVSGSVSIGGSGSPTVTGGGATTGAPAGTTVSVTAKTTKAATQHFVSMALTFVVIAVLSCYLLA